MSLPPPSENQAYCTVSVLRAGFAQLPLARILDSVTDPSEMIRAPCLSFLLRHSVSGDTFVFDLGLRKDWETGLPPTQAAIIKQYFTVDIPEDVADSLQKGGLAPEQIAHVCISHMHFDHIGDTAPFTRATFVVGAETRALHTPGYPADPNGFVRSDVLPAGRTRYLERTEMRTPVGPFPHAYDWYGDGSLYLVDAPGHLPGQLTALVRTSADGGWVFLVADAAHDWRLIAGEAGIADSEHLGCMHQDKATAAATIGKIQEVAQNPRVRVLLAHDTRWYEANKDGNAFWPGSLESL
ncbi:uncharacterized protein FIBRA_07221 [Fibroporia radiculosa]|uniref:Metallo-beta-lactamase domain-containing protein n=1 Tax=Fibroporia radiculosa TaxID=599839 RepID=J4I0C1_9APHY|nr:uncharacterized protein FIBRA_07221 [Fibroporia radiculosa]CCM05022.1 predicted protein [Fibroporia radiculosa]